VGYITNTQIHDDSPSWWVIPLTHKYMTTHLPGIPLTHKYMTTHLPGILCVSGIPGR
jgi:hypothetical protein